MGTLPDTTEDRTLQTKQAQYLAEQQRLSPKPGRVEPFKKYLRELEALLTHAYQTFLQGSEEEVARSYAAEWLLDNFYIVQQALRQIREGLPVGYYRKLPKLDIEPLRYPRIYGIAREIVQNATTPIDIQKVRRFIRAYQRAAPLTMGELWALPLMLRLAALGVLGQALAHLTGSKAPVPARITPPPDLREETLVANSIISLHTLANQDWKAFFESVSQVEEILRTDPAQVYAHMDFKTRDRYRGAVEALALQTGKDEVQVAREAIALARSVPRKKQTDSSNRAGHVGFYLVDAGRTLLETRLGYHVPFTEKVLRQLRSHPTLMYIGSALALTGSLLIALLSYTLRVGGTVAQTLAAGLLGVIPAMTLSLTLLNHWITHSLPPRILPKMAFEKGLPGDCATMVVIPVLIKSKEEIVSLLHQLELHYLGNIDPHLTFALLTDFADAPQPEMPGEAELLERLKQGIEQLNQKYRGEPSPFYLFHRAREWNAAEGCWMGWERKRGKLVEFNHLLTGGGRTSYTVKLGALEILPRIRYVITLDADTTLPRDGARQLVATLAHPLNRAEFDPQTRAVVAGYTVLQPRVSITPTSANASLFSQIFAGDTGIDLYTRAVSDIYQDLFGEGIYTGKGIYDVAAFEQSLQGRVPDNRLLSHDLFEGIHGRAGLVTDIVLYEDYPPHYLAYTRRLHRWVRGDWQLLPWLGPRVPHVSGKLIKSNLSPLDRWKILDNLRRSLVPPALMAFLVIGWLWLPGPAWVWTVIGALTLGLPFLTQLTSDITHYLKTYEAPAFTSATRFGLFRWLLGLAFLPYEGSIMTDAVLTTLDRMYISHKRLLQWTTAAHTVTLFGKTTHVKITLNLMLRSPLIACILALLCAWLRPEALASAAPLLCGWALAPWLAHALSRPLASTSPILSVQQHQLLRSLARRTWLYFEHFVGPDDAWLPPDHFQEDPKGMTSHSTSPTNIGLTILSALAAYDLGYMSLFDLTLRLRPTFGTLKKLSRYRGHFLNWYDTRTLEPLPPRYVSTVDSGNLAGALIAFQQGCHTLPATPILRWARFQGLIDIIDILIEYLADEVTSDDALKNYLLKVQGRITEERPFPEHWFALLQEFSQQISPEINRLLVEMIKTASRELDAEALSNLHAWVVRLNTHLHSLYNEIELLLPWLISLHTPPTLFTDPESAPRLHEAWEALQHTLPLTTTLDNLSLICKDGGKQLAELRACRAQTTPDGGSRLVRVA
ncbi:MAG: cellobiose phosphorylase, partial [Anaerolineae bacterium]|nr:cellobiose phosphorylase [Anaerolineae bacterium]